MVFVGLRKRPHAILSPQPRTLSILLLFLKVPKCFCKLVIQILDTNQRSTSPLLAMLWYESFCGKPNGHRLLLMCNCVHIHRYIPSQVLEPLSRQVGMSHSVIYVWVEPNQVLTHRRSRWLYLFVLKLFNTTMDTMLVDVIGLTRHRHKNVTANVL